MTTYESLIQKLYHGHNPYAGYPAHEWGAWYDDPGAKREIFKTVIQEAKPGIVVEVGSFVGESTIHIAKLLKAMGSDAMVLAVDTWMGGIDHWEKVPEKLRFHFGRPSLYYQFLGNIITYGVSDTVLPISLDSINGARLLKLMGIVPNLVYVDASHEEGDVLRDLEAYWKLLPKGGVLLVDDISNHFPGVVRDWLTFIEMKHLKADFIEGEKQAVIKR